MLRLPWSRHLHTALTGGTVDVLLLTTHPADAAVLAMEIALDLSLVVLIGFIVDVADLAEVIAEFLSAPGTLISRLQG
jgi:hypothetical protein